MQLGWDWQWVPCVYPSHLAIRCVQQHQTAAMRCWRLEAELLDQTSRRRPAGRPWLLVAGSVVVLVHAWIMDAWPVLKLTPGAKAQRSQGGSHFVCCQSGYGRWCATPWQGKNQLGVQLLRRSQPGAPGDSTSTAVQCSRPVLEQGDKSLDTGDRRLSV